MLTYQSKRIEADPLEKTSLNFQTPSLAKRLIGIYCINANTQDVGLVQFGLSVAGKEIFPEDFPMRMLMANPNKTLFKAFENGFCRYFDLTDFHINASGNSIQITIKGNYNFGVTVVLIYDNYEPLALQTKKYQITRIAHQIEQSIRKEVCLLPNLRKLTGIALISDQLTDGFYYASASRFGLKVAGKEIFPAEYPANNLLVNAHSVQMHQNFYDLKPFNIPADGLTAELTYLHQAPGFCLDPDLIVIFELQA